MLQGQNTLILFWDRKHDFLFVCDLKKPDSMCNELHGKKLLHGITLASGIKWCLRGRRRCIELEKRANDIGHSPSSDIYSYANKLIIHFSWNPVPSFGEYKLLFSEFYKHLYNEIIWKQNLGQPSLSLKITVDIYILKCYTSKWYER